MQTNTRAENKEKEMESVGLQILEVEERKKQEEKVEF